MAFVFRAVGEVGATMNTALVVMGDKLGLYKALGCRWIPRRRMTSPSQPVCLSGMYASG